MGKIESLDKLDRLGFNVPKRLLELKGNPSSLNREMWRLWRNEAKINGPSKVSIRTEKLGRFKTPHFPNVSLTRADKEMKSLLNEEYNVYIFEPIDPHQCEYRGNIVFTRGGALIVEYLTGPGTVRDLETQVPTIMKVDGPHPSLDFNELSHVISKVQLNKKRLIDQIVEWSIYKYPVGKLKQEDIYWEIRPWH